MLINKKIKKIQKINKMEQRKGVKEEKGTEKEMILRRKEENRMACN